MNQRKTKAAHPDARFIKDCRILANDEVAPGQYRMRLHGPEIARAYLKSVSHMQRLLSAM